MKTCDDLDTQHAPAPLRHQQQPHSATVIEGHPFTVERPNSLHLTLAWTSYRRAPANCLHRQYPSPASQPTIVAANFYPSSASWDF